MKNRFIIAVLSTTKRYYYKYHEQFNCFEVIKYYRTESSINEFSLFLYPSLFSNPLTTLSKTDNDELHTLVNNVFVGLVIKVTFVLRERS